MTTPPPQASPSRQSNIPANSRRSKPRVSLAAWSPNNLTQRRHCGSPLEHRTTAAGRLPPHLLGPNLNHRVPTPHHSPSCQHHHAASVDSGLSAAARPVPGSPMPEPCPPGKMNVSPGAAPAPADGSLRYAALARFRLAGSQGCTHSPSQRAG